MPSNGLTLNLGSGKDYKTDCVNADIRADVGADWVLDICKLSLGEVIQSPVGLVTIKPFCFDRIIANDVLEHIPDLVTAMTNCRDLLREGGENFKKLFYDSDPNKRSANGQTKSGLYSLFRTSCYC